MYKIIFLILMLGTMDVSNWALVEFGSFPLSALRVCEFLLLFGYFAYVIMKRKIRTLGEYIVWVVLSGIIICLQSLFLERYQSSFIFSYSLLPFIMILGKELRISQAEIAKCINIFLAFLLINIPISMYEFFTFENILGTTNFRFDGFYFPPLFMGTRTDGLFVTTETYFSMLMLGFVFSLIMIKNTQKKRYFLISSCLLGANLFCFFKTAIIAEVIILIYYLLFISKKNRKRKLLTIFLVEVILLSVILILFSTNLFLEQMDSGANSRLGGHLKAFMVIKQNLLFGYGDQYIKVTSAINLTHSGYNSNDHAHNLIVQVLLEGGLIVLCYLFYFIIRMFKQMNRTIRASKSPFHQSYLKLCRIFAYLYLFLVGSFFGIGTLPWVNIFFMFVVSGSRGVIESVTEYPKLNTPSTVNEDLVSSKNIN